MTHSQQKQERDSRYKKGQVAIINSNGRLQLRFSYAGKRHYLSLGLPDDKYNRKAAEARANEIQSDIAFGRFDPTLAKYKPENTLTLLQNFLDQLPASGIDKLWEKYCEHRKPQVAETTFRKDYLVRYKNCFDSLPTKNLNEASIIRDYILKNYPKYTAKRLITQLTACCKWAMKTKLITENPFDGMAEEIKLPSNNGEKIDPFTAIERDAIIQAFTEHPVYNHYTNFVKFLFMTGCRTGEAIGLQWKHIKADCSGITFSESVNSRFKIRKDTKTHKSRKFPCNESLQKLLQSIKPDDCNPEQLVFTSLTGIGINNEGFLNDVWRGCKRHGKQHDGIVTRLVKEGKVERYRPQYNTRHTFITMALEAGISPVQVAKWAGNSAEIIMKHYAGTTLKIQVPEM